MFTPNMRRCPRIAAVIVVVLPLVLSACGGGYDPKSHTTEELIATVEDASVGNPPGPTEGPSVGRYLHLGARCDAAEELGVRKATSAVDALIAALQDGRVASCAAQALGKIGDARAVLPLLELYERGIKYDQSGKIETCVTYVAEQICLPREDVGRALEQIGPVGLDQLIPMADAANMVAQATACAERPFNEVACRENAKLEVVRAVLGGSRDRRLEPIFVEWLKTPTFGRDGATALALMYRDEVDHLLPLLQSKETVDIAYGIIGLGQVGTEKALIDGLMHFGDKALAGFYLNCGNDQLETAVHDWADANGYMVTQMPTYTYGGGGSTKDWGTLAGTP